eukprot:gene32536-39337_t
MFPKATQVVVGVGDKKITVQGVNLVEKKQTVPEKLEKKPQKRRLSLIPLALLSICISIVFSSPFLYLLYTRLGLGSDWPAQNHLLEAAPVLPDDSLEVVATLPLPPFKLAASSKGRLFYVYHPEIRSALKVMELKQNSTIPFPSMAMQKVFLSVSTLKIDAKDRLWILDHANHGLSSPPKLFAFDLQQQDRLVMTYPFPAHVAGVGSRLSDMTICPKGAVIYIADASPLAATPAIIAYSIVTQRKASAPSSSSSSSRSQAAVMRLGPFGMRVHVSHVSLDRTGAWLFFAALTSPKIYAMAAPASPFDHADSPASLAQLQANVSRSIRAVAQDKPVSSGGGMTVDGDGGVWISSPRHSAVFLFTPPTPPRTQNPAPSLFSFLSPPPPPPP